LQLSRRITKRSAVQSYNVVKVFAAPANVYKRGRGVVGSVWKEGKRLEKRGVNWDQGKKTREFYGVTMGLAGGRKKLKRNNAGGADRGKLITLQRQGKVLGDESVGL